MSTIWIALVEARPNESNTEFKGKAGLVVNTISFASSAKDFRNRVTKKLEELDLELVEIMDLELFSKRLAYGFADDQIRQLAENARNSGDVEFDTFHTYRNRD